MECIKSNIHVKLTKEFVITLWDVRVAKMSGPSSLDVFCGDLEWIASDKSTITTCITEGFIQTSLFVLIVPIVIRLLQLRGIERRLRHYTKWHIVELIAHLLIILVIFLKLVVGLILFSRFYLIVNFSVNFLGWSFSMYIANLEFSRGLNHTWHTILWIFGCYIVQSMVIHSVYTARNYRAYDLGINIFLFAIIQVLSFGTFYKVDYDSILKNTSKEAKGSDDQINKNFASLDENFVSKSFSDGNGENDTIYKESLILNGADGRNTQRMIPRHQSSLISRLFFLWMTPLFHMMNNRKLGMEDLPELSMQDRTEYYFSKFAAFWKKQCWKPRPSVLHVINKVFFWDFFGSGIIKLFSDILNFVNPFVLSMLISFIGSHDPIYKGVILAVAMGLVPFVQSLLLHTYFFRLFRLGMRMRAALVSSIYEKMFFMSYESMKQYSTGDIINLQSVETDRLERLCPYLHTIWSGTFQIVVSLVFLYMKLGVSICAGICVLLMTTFANYFVNRAILKNQKELLVLRAERIKLVGEVLGGIHLIKYYAWEQNFFARVNEIRAREISRMRFGTYIKAFNLSLWSISTILVSLTSFIMYILLGGKLTAEIVFPSIALFNILRFPINILPDIISSIVESIVSLKKITSYLSCAEIDPKTVKCNPKSPFAVQIVDGTFGWDPGRDTLIQLNFFAKRGQLVGVIGEFNSGKSSLLSAILGFIPKTNGILEVNGSIGYCSQLAWIQNATLKSNILFGNEMDSAFYKRVLNVCALEEDISQLPNGDETEIGERGINLSGGQKQRVALARAIYQKKDIYLLDDPLSAVDVHVGKHIFERCILEALHGKTRILVTHQLQYASRMEYIFLLHNGRIVDQGTYKELIDNHGEFYKLVSNIEELNMEDDKKMPRIGDRDFVPLIDEEIVPNDTKNEKKTFSNYTISDEKRSVGNVNFYTYMSYFRSLGGLFLPILIILFFLFDSSSRVSSDYWIAYWVNLDAKDMSHDLKWYMAIYVTLGFASCFFIILRCFTIVRANLNASRTVHAKMMATLLACPIRWFELNPTGRLMNRFSKDINVLDEKLTRTLSSALSTAFSVLSVFVVIFYATPWIFTIVLCLAYLYNYIKKYYLNLSLELQRLNSISRSPLQSLFSETFNGIWTIKAFDKIDHFMIFNKQIIDRIQKPYFIYISSNRWLGLRLEFVGNFIVFGTALFAVFGRNEVSASIIGLSITYAMQMTGQLNWLVRMSAEVENEFINVERCIEFTNLPPEEDPEVVRSFPLLDPSWPSNGKIEFNSVSLRYSEDLPFVLKDLSFVVNPQEKIGIVGRTGAGKSSLINTLFRFVEITHGNIIIDGVDICKIRLHDLRSKVVIIPQTPTLFEGTIRYNLDPFNEHTDDEIWRCLEAVEVKSLIFQMNGKLDEPLTEFGNNLSIGTKQLLCLARSLLRKPKILVMDEVTASIDYASDEKIQLAIRNQFKYATTLIIAHRITTISDCDRVMVLEDGKIVEFDKPSTLLQNPNGLYSKMYHLSTCSSNAKRVQ